MKLTKTGNIRVAHGYWSNLANRRKALEQIGKKFGVKQLDDWYNVPVHQVRKKYPFIIEYYNGSTIEALRQLFPTHQWSLSRFRRVSRSFWSNLDNQRDALERVGKEFGVKELDDWYKVPRHKVVRKAKFIKYFYQENLVNALETLYPNHPWDTSKFTILPKSYWRNVNNQRKKLDEIGRGLGVQKLDDWYKISRKKVYDQTEIIRKYYDGDFYEALKVIYPEHNWNPFRFKLVAKVMWKCDKKLFLSRMDELLQHLGIHKWKNYYNLPPMQLSMVQMVMTSFLNREKSVLSYLHSHSSIISKLQTSKLTCLPRQSEQLLQRILQSEQTFPRDLKLEEIQSIVQGSNFFTRVDREEFITFNYPGDAINKRQMFPDPSKVSDKDVTRRCSILRELRGLKFSHDGELLCRPLHKFWSVDELLRTNSSINIDDVESITEKYDGVMIAPIKINNRILFLDREGYTRNELDQYLESNRDKEYEKFVDGLLTNKITPIFEFISPSHGTVKYDTTSLILLGARDNKTGRYLTHKELRIEEFPNIPIARSVPIPSSWDEVLKLKQEIGTEGFVLRLVNGSLFKLKTLWWTHFQKANLRTKSNMEKFEMLVKQLS